MYGAKYIISDKYNFVYFVTPKVACSSIKVALFPLFEFEEKPVEFTPEIDVHKLFDRSNHLMGKRRLLEGMGEGLYEDHFKFAFVRNPYDRLVSCYLSKIAPGGQGLWKEEYGDIPFWIGMTFEEFVEAVCCVPDEEADVHFRSQYVTVYDENELLADFVGRFENLEEDFAYVARRTGLHGLELPYLMRSPSRNSHSYTEFYDDRLERLVRERYQKDLETFGYSF